MRSIVVVACLACGCSARQARTAKTVGEVTAAASLIGMLGAVGAAELVPSDSGDFMRAGIVFVPFAVIGALVYAAGDSLQVSKEPPATAHDRAWQTAFELARQAKHAARANDCAEVQAIEPRVRELDSDVYRRFRNDQVIQRCLAPGPEP